jgi:anti-anti-sigma regulatory factor
MARIRTVKGALSTRVVIAGELGAGDMRRLEHACGRALTSAHPDLILDLTRVTELDGVAAAHLRRMATRGAIIKRAG